MNKEGLTDATAGSFADLDVSLADKGRIGVNPNEAAGRADLRLVFTEMHTEREVRFLLFYEFYHI